MLVLPLSSYRAPAWNHRQLVLDPIGRYLTPRLRGERRAGRRRGAAVGGGPAGARRGQALAEPTPEERAAALRRIGIGAVVTDRTAPGDPPPEIAGEMLLDEPDLLVTALDEVDVRDVQTSWRRRDGGRLADLPDAVGTGVAGAPSGALLTQPRRAATPSDR